MVLTKRVKLLALLLGPVLVRVLGQRVGHLEHGARQVDGAQVGRVRVVVALQSSRLELE